MTAIKTNLQPPPEYRGGDARPYARELYQWALKYHLTLEPLVAAAQQRMSDIGALATLTQTISSPPTQAQVETIQAKVNAIITLAGAEV